MPYEACMIDLTKKGVSQQGAARACAIALYQETGMMPGDSKLKDNKSSISKQAEKIAAQYSIATTSIHEPGESFRLNAEDPFLLSEEFDSVDIFQPFMVEERGFTPRLMREVFLIRAGEFNGIKFTEEDLQALVDNWERPIPFQIDHSTAWRDNVGSLLSIRKHGNKVFGLAEFLGWNTIDAVQSGRAKEVSIGFYLKPRKLSEVSLTQFPAVGGKDPARIVNPPLKKKPMPKFERNETPTLETLESDRLESVTLDTMETSNGGQAPAKGTEMPKENDPPAAIVNLSESAILAQMNKQIEELQAKFADAEKKNEQLQSQVHSANQILRLQRNTGIVVEFASKGLMLTANKDAELEFINGLSDEQLVKYQALKEANGPVIALGRISTPENRLPGEALTDQELAAKKARLKSNYAAANVETLNKK